MNMRVALVQVAAAAALIGFSSIGPPAIAQTDLEKSVQSLVMQQEVLRLIAQYGFTWDAKDASGYSAVFADGGVLETRRPGTEKSEVRGRAAIQEFANKNFSTRLADRQTRHYQTNTEIQEMTGDIVRSRTVFVVIHILAADRSRIVSGGGIYEDEFRRTSGGWKINRRVIHVD